MAYLELDGIAKEYGGRTVLRPTTLHVERGEFVCFLGPSGSGKTTLLNCLCGVTEPSGGRVLLEGSDITRVPLERRHFGVVFQQYALFPNLTAAGNVAYGLRGMAPAARRQRVADMLRLVGLEELGARLPARLSGGQQQRVAVARALAPSPRLLLMD
ncbi:MAG: ABC transporter ATP-binding protein, partial [Desulfovibrio sp.]|nr:ABC transporter ATP-binding protein [Desulfovibrio sp.]